MPVQERTFENAKVCIFDSRDAMGKAAAGHVVRLINDILKGKQSVSIIFAAAPSQNEFLAHLSSSGNVDWSRVEGFHMDEYIGLPETSDQFFSLFLQKHLFSKVRMNKVHLMNAHAQDTGKECDRYASLLHAYPVDIACLGIGENGHIAFNDPPFADFHDPKLVKVVELDAMDRQQQVNDGCFPTIEDVPSHAYTLTIPALLSATYLSCVVPSERKAKAVFNSLKGEISTLVPASILRTHSHIEMFLDTASASLL